MNERMEVKELERRYYALLQELFQVEQILGLALGYPRYADDPKNFPDATEFDGICVGEMTPGLLAEQMVQRLAKKEAELEELNQLWQERSEKIKNILAVVRRHHL